MGLTERVLKNLAAKSAKSGLSWIQAVDLVCAMLGITARHIVIDSARAVVHLRWVQLGKPYALNVPFNDIVAAINAPVGSHAGPAGPTHVQIGPPRSYDVKATATSPP